VLVSLEDVEDLADQVAGCGAVAFLHSASLGPRLGIWYLAALDRLTKLHYGTVVVIIVVIAFCLVQLALIGIPMLAFKLCPRQTPLAIDSAKAWASRHGRRYGVVGLVIIAGLLVIRGVIGLLS
jgi:hypothetical protein